MIRGTYNLVVHVIDNKSKLGDITWPLHFVYFKAIPKSALKYFI